MSVTYANEGASDWVYSLNAFPTDTDAELADNVPPVVVADEVAPGVLPARGWSSPKSISGVVAEIQIKDLSLTGAMDVVSGFYRVNGGSVAELPSLEDGGIYQIAAKRGDKVQLMFSNEFGSGGWSLPKAVL